MALMKFKRSAVPAKVPSIVDLALGELAINTYDGKLFLKKNDGTESIVEIGAGGGGGSGTVTSVSGTGSVSGLTLSGTVTSAGSITLGGTLALTSGDITGGLGFTPATAAQGAKADTAVQTIASTDGSVTITGTTAIDLSVAVAGSTSNVLLPVRNTTGATLTKGTAVYISGATGQLSTVSKAIATSDATSAQTLGLVTANIANNSNGNVTLIGTITNIDTSAYTDGQQLYLSPTTAGTLTATKPYAPSHLVYMAVVEHAHPTQGKLFVKVQNGYEMDELHDVSAQTPSNNDGLFYNTSTSLWESKSIVTALGYTPYNASNPSGYLSTVNLTTNVTGTLPVANGGTGVTAVGAAGNVLTSDGTAWVSQLPASGGMTYTAVKTANFTASANTGVQTNTGGGAFTVTLPASPAVGAQVVVVDSANSWATNNLTVGRNGSTIEGDASDLVCDISGVSVQLIYNGTTWDVFAQAGGAGGGTAGTLAVSGGGTGSTSLAANAVLLGNGTSPLQTVAPSTSGNVLTSNGTTWVSSAAPSGAVSYPQNTQSSAYTLVLSDAGKHIYSSNTAVQTITIPTNASVAFPIGSVITIVNMGTNKILISASGVSIVPDNTLSPLVAAQIPSGASVQLLKIDTNAWKATSGTVIADTFTASYLVIAGGASGGRNNGGGGGAGGYLTNTALLSRGSTYAITVGAGGAAASGTSQGNDGSNSLLSGSGVSVTSTGGGGGGTQNGTATGRAGGSGGGSSYPLAASGAAASGQGFAGGIGSASSGNGGGGGGASAVGVNADAGSNQGNGGAGLASSITGTSVTRAGGGGSGGADFRGLGGAGGGGNGGYTSNAVAGTANTGSGGGGGSSNLGTNSGAGGSGVVILSIPTADYTGTTTGSPTVTTSGSNTILQFNSSGSYTA